MQFITDLTNKQPIIVASHPRSGTHLTIDLFRKQFRECQAWKYPGEPLDRLYLAIEALSASKKPISEKTAKTIITRSQRPLIKTHCYPKFDVLLPDYEHWVNWINQSGDFIYVLRDGRDVMCSFHLFMQSFDPTTRCSLSEFIHQTPNNISRPRRWANHVRSWLNIPGIYVLRYERVIKETKEILDELAEQFNLAALYTEPFLPNRLRELRHSRWNRLAKRKPESTAILGCHQNQKVQRWREAFTLEDRQFFQQETEGLLIQLGYANSENWVHNS